MVVETQTPVRMNQIRMNQTRLFRATKSPFYLHAGAEMLDSLNRHVRTECGFGTLHSVTDRTLEDRMESFFLAETVKYLYVSLHVIYIMIYIQFVASIR